MSTSSKQGFVEYFRRNILCSPGRHIESADPVTMYHVIVRLRTLGKITDLKLTAVSIRVIVNETRGRNNDLVKTTDMYTIYKG